MLIADIVKPVIVQAHRDSRPKQVSRATLRAQDVKVKPHGQSCTLIVHNRVARQKPQRLTSHVKVTHQTSESQV
jgi:hypothetical protein